jgi:hypothetical protein
VPAQLDGTDLTRARWAARGALLFSIAFFLAFTQNFVAILLSPYSFTFARAMLVAKEVYIDAVLFLGAIAFLASVAAGRITFRKPVALMWAVIVGLCAYAVISPAFNLLSFRQLLIIPLLALYGSCFSARTDLRSVWVIVLALLVAVCLSGYIERFVLFDSQERFWRVAGIDAYMHMKGFAAWAFGPWGIPGNYYSSDLVAVLGVQVRRMTSLLIGDPTLLGQVLVLPFLYSWFARRWAWAAFFGVAILCAVSKVGLLGCAVGLAFWGYQRQSSGALKRLAIFTVLALAGVGLVILVQSGQVGSMVLHFRGLATNALSLLAHPFGRGIGGAGNFAVLAAESAGAGNVPQSLATSGESYFGTVIGQLGVFGLGAYVAFGWWLWRLRTGADKPIQEAVKYAALATLAMGVASESAISYVGSGYVFALVGFLWVGQRNHVPTSETSQPIQA